MSKTQVLAKAAQSTHEEAPRNTMATAMTTGDSANAVSIRNIRGSLGPFRMLRCPRSDVKKTKIPTVYAKANRRTASGQRRCVIS